MPFQIIRNDITKVKADAIVNTANPKPVVGGGTDSAVYEAAGEENLLQERKKIGDIAPGRAAYTHAFRLKAKYIIHTVGPSWIDGEHGEREILHACYRNSLALAAKLKCRSVAFPLIATGVYQFPKDEALQIALSEISGFLFSHEMEVILVVFDRRAFELSAKLSHDIREFIDEFAVQELKDTEYARDFGGESGLRSGPLRRPSAGRRLPDAEEDIAAPVNKRLQEVEKKTAAPVGRQLSAEPAEPELSDKSLEEVLKQAGPTFQEKLFELIDASGMDDVTVYKNAYVDRKVFSHIRNTKNYQPSKKTAISFAIALHLDMKAAQDLLRTAGFALSSNTFDQVIAYFITHEKYDIPEIDSALFDTCGKTLYSKK